ncbi:MAG: ester cyclase [Nakamurella sp.]
MDNGLPATDPPTPVAKGPDSQPEQWGESTTLTAVEQLNLEAIALVVPGWNQRDVAAIMQHYDDEIIWRNVAMGQTYRGKTEVGEYLADLFRGVPDLQMNITMRMPRGEFVAEEYTIRGTHLGTLFGIPATGRKLEIKMVSFVQMRDGKFKEDHFYYDATSIMVQMGLFPPLTIAQTRVGHALMGVAVFLRSPRRAISIRRSFRK